MRKVKVGDIYWDCSYHPVLCTESYPAIVKQRLFKKRIGWDVAGVSLFDGSEPRACSVNHCGVIVLKPEQVAWLIKHRNEWLDAERQWRGGKTDAYGYMIGAWNEFVEEATVEKS